MKTLASHHLTTGFIPKKNVVEDISIRVAPGGITGLIGPNGCGKSTLIKSLAGWMPASHGRVCIDEKELKELPNLERARHVGVLPQHVEPPASMTLKHYVSLGLFCHRGWLATADADDQVAIDNSLRQFGIQHLSESPATGVSGGEFQRARLAQLHLQDPDVILMDEPFSFLDWSYQRLLTDYVRTQAHSCNKAILISLHDLNIAMALCSSVVLMSGGRVVAEGAPAQILTAENLEKLFGTAPRCHEIPENPGRVFTIPSAKIPGGHEN